MRFTAWDGEEKRLYVINADDVEQATSILADAKTARGGGSDGDEFNVQPLALPEPGEFVEVILE
jgi:hypothetical protein